MKSQRNSISICGSHELFSEVSAERLNTKVNPRGVAVGPEIDKRMAFPTLWHVNCVSLPSPYACSANFEGKGGGVLELVCSECVSVFQCH